MSSPLQDVEEDTLTMVGALLSDARFRAPSSLAGHGTVLASADDVVVAVPWEVVGTSDGQFLGVPRGTPVTLRGVTIVDTAAERYYRYVDWSTLLDELNLGVSLRPIEVIQDAQA